MLSLSIWIPDCSRTAIECLMALPCLPGQEEGEITLGVEGSAAWAGPWVPCLPTLFLPSLPFQRPQPMAERLVPAGTHTHKLWASCPGMLVPETESLCGKGRRRTLMCPVGSRLGRRMPGTEGRQGLGWSLQGTVRGFLDFRGFWGEGAGPLEAGRESRSGAFPLCTDLRGAYRLCPLPSF